MSVPEPKRSLIIDHAHERIIEVADYRDTHPPRPELPQSLQCDFCGCFADRLWRRPVRPFSVEMWPARMMSFQGGRWNACIFCDPLVAARDTNSLIARVITVNTLAADLESGFERLFAVVFAAMEDAQPVEWTAGQPFPVSEASGS